MNARLQSTIYDVACCNLLKRIMWNKSETAKNVGQKTALRRPEAHWLSMSARHRGFKREDLMEVNSNKTFAEQRPLWAQVTIMGSLCKAVLSLATMKYWHFQTKCVKRRIVFLCNPTFLCGRGRICCSYLKNLSFWTLLNCAFLEQPIT